MINCKEDTFHPTLSLSQQQTQSNLFRVSVSKVGSCTSTNLQKFSGYSQFYSPVLSALSFFVLFSVALLKLFFRDRDTRLFFVVVLHSPFLLLSTFYVHQRSYFN